MPPLNRDSDSRSTNSTPSQGKSDGLAFANAIIRFIAFAVLVVGGFCFASAEFKTMFEEYGINLPRMTELFFSLTRPVRNNWFIAAPLLLALWLLLEFAVFSIPRDKGRRVVNIGVWLLLILFILFTTAVLAMPYIALRNGLMS